MQLKIYSAPAIEPVSLQDVKEHLRLDSGAFSDNLSTTNLIASGSHAVTSGYCAPETMTLNVAPGGAGWAAGDTITGVTSAKTCKVIEKLTNLTYTVWNRSGTYTSGEVLTNGTATADQGAGYPAFTRAYADVLGYSAVVQLSSGINGTGGTHDCKIQESDDASTWTDWTGGAFAQVTTSNDNAVQKIAYTGSKRYISVVSKVLVAACEFTVDCLKYSSDATEDAILSALITSARQEVEAITKRALITQTWDAWMDEFPEEDFFTLPFGNLQSVTSLAYTNSSGTTTTMTVTTDYLVDSSSEPGRIVLPYAGSWPSFTAYPVNPIACRFVCGYGATAASVPASIRTAIKMIVEDLYNNRSAVDRAAPGGTLAHENPIVMLLLGIDILREF